VGRRRGLALGRAGDVVELGNEEVGHRREAAPVAGERSLVGDEDLVVLLGGD